MPLIWFSRKLRRLRVLVAAVWSLETTKVEEKILIDWNWLATCLAWNSTSCNPTSAAACEVIELVIQRHLASAEGVLGQVLVVLLHLQDLGEGVGEILEFRGKLLDAVLARGVSRAGDRSVDRLLQARLGRLRRLGVLVLPRHDEVAGGRAIGDQLAVDVAGEVRFRDAVAVGGDRGRDVLEPEISDAKADRRDGKDRSKSDHHFCAEPQGRQPLRPGTLRHSHPQGTSQQKGTSQQAGSRPEPEVAGLIAR